MCSHAAYVQRPLSYKEVHRAPSRASRCTRNTVAGDTASTASADELSREVLHQNNLSEDSRNIYFLKDAPVMRALLALGIPMQPGWRSPPSTMW